MLISSSSSLADQWSAFRAWLIDTRGLASTTARTSACQARRVLREACNEEDVVTAESLRAWESQCPSHHVRSYRASFRRYREYAQVTWGADLPDFAPPRVPDEGVPDAVIEAINEAIEAGVRATLIVHLRHDLVSPANGNESDAALHRALGEGNPGVRDGSLRVVRCDDSTLALVPAACWDAWREWAWPAGSTRVVCPAVPKAPGSLDPMPVAKLRRLARRFRDQRHAGVLLRA
jgi:hypothetical protein